MSFLDPIEVSNLQGKLITDLPSLGKLYKAKKSDYYQKNVDHSLVEGMLADGWEEFGTPLKTKTKLRKLKEHSTKFENDLWCQCYELGYRCLNYDENFILPFGQNSGDKKQIDVIAADDDTILLIECKSKEKRTTKIESYKTELEGLGERIYGFGKSLKQIFKKKSVKIKYIFATRKIRLHDDGADIKRLIDNKSFYYNDNTYDYVNELIKSYKNAARYQYLGLLFKDQLISRDKIEVPAIEGKMGKETYYMFSIEPHLLLKMGFILHRTKANEAEMPTYQRLLRPARLKGISKFINDGGYFPNSIILNFSQKVNQIEFVPASTRAGVTKSRFGTLKIPNAFAIAYIIDGQHRVYGYANSEYKETNTIPVVAFKDLEATEQLQIFMDINENQKAVSADLRLTLEEDLYWDSNRADLRFRALRSSIVKALATPTSGPLYNKITIGEDKSVLASKPFATALSKSGLLPVARGNQYDSNSVTSALYNINNQNHNDEMVRARKNIVRFLNLCYGYVEEHYPEIFERKDNFIISNRGTYAFICLVGSLNDFETTRGRLNIKSTPAERFKKIEKYLNHFLERIKNLTRDEEDQMLPQYGSGAETKWLRFFQWFVNTRFNQYEPVELIDWKERQDDNLQDEGRKLGVEVEKFIKHKVLEKLHQLYGDDWDLEIGEIQQKCEIRAKEQIQRAFKDGLGRQEIPWTDMFFINDYKVIIEKSWTKFPDPVPDGFKNFETEFSFDAGFGLNSKADCLKWIVLFNSYRNLWAHEGTKEKRLNREEVGFLKSVHDRFVLNV